MPKRKKSDIVGGYFWTAGPLVLGTSTVRAKVQTAREPKLLEALAKETVGPVLERKLAKERVLLFPGQFPSTWHSLGPRAGVLVRRTDPRRRRALRVDGERTAPHEAPFVIAVRAFFLVVLATLGAFAGCSRPTGAREDASASSSTVSTKPGPVSACGSDAECRLVACSGCSCRGVHRNDPDGCAPAVCAMWPCTGLAAICDVGTHQCRTAKQAPDAGSNGAR